MGFDLQTNEPFALPISAFRRGGYFTGQSGQGKSSTICRLLVEVTRRGSPALVIDDAGETFQQLERFAAFYAAELNAAMIRRDYPEHVRRRVLRKKVLRRFTFGFLGHGRPNEVSIDLLKRRQLPGRVESIEEVVVGTLKPFEARFADITNRVRFLRIIEVVLTALIAGERPISESHALLRDPRYYGFLLREIERCRTLDDRESREYVQPRLLELRELLLLRRNKYGDEIPPFPRDYRDQVESTINALNIYRPGNRTSRFFDTDSFTPEEVVFHNGVFAVTTNISDEVVRNQALSTVYTFFERMMKYRVPDMGLDRFRLFLVLDEIRWFYESLTRFLSVARNHRVSTFILNQQDEQWEQLGLPAALAKTIPSLLRLRIQYRAQTDAAANEMAASLSKYDPFGMQQRETTRSHAAGRSTERSHGRQASDTDSEGTSTSRSRASRTGRAAGVNAGWQTNAERDYTGYSGGTSGVESYDDSLAFTEGMQAGSSSTRGRSYNVGESESDTHTIIEHILTASVADQHFLRMQDMRRLPEHCALVRSEEQSALVRMLRFNGFPKIRDGKDILGEFRKAGLHDHGRRRAERPPYDPTIRMLPPPAVVGDEPMRPGKNVPDKTPKKPGKSGPPQPKK